MADSISDIVRALQDTSPFAAAPAPGDPLVIAPQATPSPVVAGDPLVITPQAPAARTRKSDDFTMSAPTMTPPPVAAVPFGSPSGMIAPRAAPPMMGDVLSAPLPKPQRQPYPTLPVYA